MGEGATQVREWRHQLQRALLRYPMPSPEEMTTYNSIFNEIEAVEMQAEWLRISKLAKVFSHIVQKDDIPRDDEYHFKARAAVLLEKWKPILDSHPIKDHAASTSNSTSSSAVEAQQDASVKEDSDKDTKTTDIPSLTIGRSSVSPPLPPEILTHIFRSQVTHSTPRIDQKYADTGHGYKEWKEYMRFLLTCCLVAKDWCAPAKYMLYRGRIMLCSSNSVKLLLRTVEEDLGTPCPIQHLLFNNIEEDGQELASLLLSRCTEICFLEGESEALSFEPSTPLPIFKSLKELRVSNQNLRQLAPLLHRLPNLEKFDALYIISDSSPPRARLSGTLPPGDPVDDIPAPTFSLRDLRLSQCSMTLEQCKWLLSTSTSIEYAQLQEQGFEFEAGPLASVIGNSVTSLHIKGAMDAPQRGDIELVRILPEFGRLTSLRVSGRDWPWDRLLSNVKSSLQSFAISYSRPGSESLTRVLLDKSWQPDIRSVTVYHWAATDYFYGVKASGVNEDKQNLQSACSARQIQLDWVTEGTASDGWAGGPTEADLI